MAFMVGSKGGVDIPIRKVKGGYKWGKRGKVYKNRKDAERQAAAAYASGYKKSEDVITWKDILKAKRIPRKKGQPANSKKHSDLYTDENPKGTIHGLGFKTVKDAKRSVAKIKRSSRTHAHKTQAAIAMEQRAREMGKKSAAGIYRTFINAQKRKTKEKRKRRK